MVQLIEAVPRVPADPSGGTPELRGLGQPAQLGRAIGEVLTEFPELQRRHRRTLATANPQQGQSLVDAWYSFHHQLTLVRYAVTLDDLDPLGPGAGDQWNLAVELVNRYTELGQELERAAADPAVGDEQVTLRELWDLTLRGDAELQLVVRCALDHLERNPPEWLHVLVDAVTDYLAAQERLSRRWHQTPGRPDERDLEHLAGLLADVQDRRDRIELVAIAVDGCGSPGPPDPDQAADDVRDDLAGLFADYPRLLASCRDMVSRLASPAMAVSTARVELLVAWGRYDDIITELGRRYGGRADRLGKVAADDLPHERDRAVGQRDLVLQCLAGAGQVLAASAMAPAW
jgi:hypothetical protein